MNEKRPLGAVRAVALLHCPRPPGHCFVGLMGSRLSLQTQAASFILCRVALSHNEIVRIKGSFLMTFDED